MIYFIFWDNHFHTNLCFSLTPPPHPASSSRATRLESMTWRAPSPPTLQDPSSTRHSSGGLTPAGSPPTEVLCLTCHSKLFLADQAWRRVTWSASWRSSSSRWTIDQVKARTHGRTKSHSVCPRRSYMRSNRLPRRFLGPKEDGIPFMRLSPS